MATFIDLTLSDDEGPDLRPSKRARSASPSDDSDVVIVEDEAEPKQRESEQTAEEIDDDIVVTAVTGKAALQDFPHPRPDCGKHGFKSEVSADNSNRCPNCYCYVCDDLASTCQFWGTGARARDHCNAHGSSYWVALKKAAKKGNRALVAQEHASTASELAVHWNSSNPQGNNSKSSRPSSASQQPSPALLWARRANAAVASSQKLMSQRSAGSTAAGSAAASSAAPGGGCHTTPPPGSAAAAAAALAAHMGSTPVTPHLAKQEGTCQPGPTPNTQAPARPPASTWLMKMPHPATVKPHMQLLATLELPVKTVKGLTIAEVARRLVDTGYYKGATGKSPEYGDNLCLDNITNSRYVPGKRKEKCDFLKLLPMVPPSGLPERPSSLRTWKIIVVPNDASGRPQAVAVTVERECKLSVLSDAVKEKLGSAGLKTTEDLVFASHQEDCDNWRWLRDGNIKMTDDQLGHSSSQFVHYAFRYPKDLLPAFKQGQNDYMRQSSTKMVLVMHEKTVSIPRPSADEYDSDIDDELLAILRPLNGRMNRMKGVRFGLPQLLVMPTAHLRGGDAADKHVKKDVMAQLSLFCRQDQQPRVNDWPFQLHRCSLRETWRTIGEGDRFASRSHTDLSCGWDSPGIAMLYAHWGSDPIAPPAGFDLEAFSAVPQLEDPEDRQRLADMPKVLQCWKDYQSEMRMLSSLPSQVLLELRQACAASPAPSNAQAVSASPHKPAAAAVLSIISAKGGSSGAGSSTDSSASAASAASAVVAAAVAAAAGSSSKIQKYEDSDRLGILKLEVYVFRHPGRNHRLIAEDYNSWGVGEPGGSRSRHYHASNQLKNMMNARLMQEPNGYHLLKEMAELERAGSATRGIAKLMEWLVTGERAAAQQPPGLAVQLHPYQLQSLSFMLEAERLDGGWRQLLWRWLPAAPTQQQLQGAPAAAAAGYGYGYGSGYAGPSSSAAAQAEEQGVRGNGVWWSPILERLSFQVPPAPWGGFLAEEMGLGKTVEVLGLVLSNPASPSVISGSLDMVSGKVLSRATLVVCAVSLVGQWCQEASKKLAGSLRMYPYHGQNRIRDPNKLATQFDLVVTTYATLASDYGKNGDGTRNPLHKIKWHRVVFDEGHTVKNIGATHSKACVNITSDRRWCCTGTPLNNDITDLLGQFAALQMQPLATKTFFDSRIKPAFTSHGYGVSLVPLLYTLRHTMVRHTKAQTIAGQSVLALPDKTEELLPVVLSPLERQTYLDVHAKAAALWASVRHFSPAAINQRLLQIMSLLLPLRRICSGGQLKPDDLALPARLEAAVEVAQQTGGLHPAAAAAAAAGAGLAAARLAVPEDNTISVPQGMECSICLDSFETPVMTPCHHWFCKECILGVLSGSNLCPLCRGNIDAVGLRAPGKKGEATPVLTRKRRMRHSSDSGSGSDSSDSDELDSAPGSAGAAAGSDDDAGGAGPSNVVECESKLQALLRELTAMRAADSSSKALVFSQYNSTLEWLKRRLPQEGFGFRTITGSMAQRQRAKAIEAFQQDPPTTVFLLSMRSGAVGINLTAASHVFLLEPCLNPALEEQAIGRAWRMGQTRKVVVKRFYVKGSVEERIMDVRAIRQGHTAATAAAAAAVGGSSPDGAGSSAAAAAAAAAADEEEDPRTGRSKNKIGAAVIAGNLKADRQVLKIAELDLLFRTPELDSGAGSSAPAAAGAAGAAAATTAADEDS